MRHLFFIFGAAIIAGCDSADSASTAPAATPQVQPVVAPVWKSVAAKSERIIGGGGLGLTIYEAG